MLRTIKLSVMIGLLTLSSACSQAPKAAPGNVNAGTVAAGVHGEHSDHADIVVVATVGDKNISEQDLEFYKLINQVQMEMLREEGKRQNKAAVAEEQMKYLEKQSNDRNALLTQVIRLQAMALLAKEKGYTVDNTQVQKDIDEVKKTYAGYSAVQDIIQQYGEEKFWNKEKDQYSAIYLVKKVQNDMVEKAKKENPNQPEKEIMFQAEKNYEELLQAQVSSLKVKINN